MQQTPTPRDKRVLKAHRKRYVEDKDLQTIADEMGKAYETIQDYFREESTERIKRMYDEEEREFLRLQLFNMAENSAQNAMSYVSEAVSHPETKPSDYNRAAKEEQNVPMRYAKMLQEIGIIPKPKERKEVTENTSSSEVEERLAEAIREKREAEE